MNKIDANKVAEAAFAYRKAYWKFHQNESEIANNGRDLGREELYDSLQEAEETLDKVLDEFYGVGWAQ